MLARIAATTYIILYYVILYYIILHYITLYHIISHYITLYYIILHYIILHYITLYHIISHYITLYYITLHYITLYYITLYYIANSIAYRGSIFWKLDNRSWKHIPGVSYISQTYTWIALLGSCGMVVSCMLLQLTTPMKASGQAPFTTLAVTATTTNKNMLETRKIG